MQVGSKVSYEINKNLNAQGTQANPHSIATASQNNRQKDIYFAQATPDSQKETTKKSSFSAKNLTNWAGIILYPIAIGIPIAMQMKRNNINKLVDSLESHNKKLISTVDDIAQDALIKTGQAKKGGPLYNLATFFGKAKDTGEELTNNIMYGLGTVVVMPLVILFSPFGKKNSSKEDKTFAVLRQPLSFATMFSVQLTVDKFFKNLIPQLNSLGKLDNIKDKDGNKLIFDEKKADTTFKDELENAKKVLKEEKLSLKIDANHTSDVTSFLKDAKEKYKSNPMEKLKEPLEKYIKANPKLMHAFEQAIYAPNRTKVLKEVSTIASNVIISQFIGCTLLNVMYGKAMKKYQAQKQPKPEVKQESAVKGGI